MQQRSSEKVKQVMALMSVLHIRVEPRQKVVSGGFLENVLFWIDDEKYPEPEKEADQEKTPDEHHV